MRNIEEEKCNALLCSDPYSERERISNYYSSFYFENFGVPLFCSVFCVNIVKFKGNLRFRNCWKLIDKLIREIEFRQWDCRNSTAQFYCSRVLCVRVWSALKIKKKGNGGNAIAEIGE